MSNKRIHWEDLEGSEKRARVPGGWLVKTYEDSHVYVEDMGNVSGYEWRVSMCFYPDPNHEWLKEGRNDDSNS